MEENAKLSKKKNPIKNNWADHPGAKHPDGHKHAPLDFIVRAQRPLVGLKLVQSIRAATHGLRAVERHNYHHP